MGNLIAYLNAGDHSSLFLYEEQGHALHFVYTALGAAVYDGANTFVLKTDHMEWFKGNVFLERFPNFDGMVPIPPYPVIMQTVLKRDDYLRQNLVVISESDVEMVIALNKGSSHEL